MPPVRFASSRSLAALGAVVFAASLPTACARGSTEADLGIGGSGGTGAHTTTVTASGTTTGGLHGASGSTTSGPGSGSCDVGGDCDACSSCAEDNMCAEQSLDCQTDDDCSSLAFCIDDCNDGDEACYDECFSIYPQGEALFDDYIDCLACSCIDACQIDQSTCP